MTPITLVRCIALRATAISIALIVGGCATETPFPPRVESDAWDQAGLEDRAPTARTLYETSRMLVARGKDAQASHAIASCIERYPDFVPAYVEAADLNIRYRNFDAAVAVLERGIEVAPNDPVLHNDLGMCWMLQNDYERALAEFFLASRAAPKNARYTANAALAAGMLGQYDRALELYQRIVLPAEAHLNLAVICEARQDQARADEEYRLADSKGLR